MIVAADLPAAVGNTPLIRLRRASEADRLRDLGQGRVHEPRPVGQGPRRALDHPRRGGERACCGPAAPSSRAPPATPASAWRWSARRWAIAPSSSSPTPRARRRRTRSGSPAPSWSRCRRCPTATRTTTCATPAGWPRSWPATDPNGAVWANQFDNVANRQAHVESTGARDLGADRRPGRRLHLRGRLGRHAGRRRRGAARAQARRQDRPRRPGRRGALHYYTHGELKAEGDVDHRGHRPGPDHRQPRGADGRHALPHLRRRGGADGLRPAARRGAVHGRLDRDQRRRRDPHGPGPRAGAHAS